MAQPTPPVAPPPTCIEQIILQNPVQIKSVKIALAPVTPRLFMSLTNSSTPCRSSSSRVDNHRSHSLIFTGLCPIRRGSPGI
jgi:hypothetical protein